MGTVKFTVSKLMGFVVGMCVLVQFRFLTERHDLFFKVQTQLNFKVSPTLAP